MLLFIICKVNTSGFEFYIFESYLESDFLTVYLIDTLCYAVLERTQKKLRKTKNH